MRTYLLIGGTSGIGLETTKLLSQNNRVIVISRENKNLDGLPNVEFLSADVTKSVDDFHKSMTQLMDLFTARAR